MRREKELEWLVADIEGLSAIILKDKRSLKEKVYIWNESLQSYKYDLAVTQRRTVSPNASQLRLNSRKDLRPKVIKPLHSDAQLPKSLVPVIENNQEKMKTKSISPPRTKNFKSPNKNKTVTPPKNNITESRHNHKQVTTADEFLEGL